MKHKEFAHLKADPASNYQACMCDPEAINLIFDMYQDMIDATPGVDYFLVSTDEVYYTGFCDKCKRPYNPENRSLAWAEFAINAHDWLTKRGRRMIAWNPAGPAMEQTVADFIDVFYGPGSPDMTSVYKLLIEGAQFFGSGWDQVTSKERGPGYGNGNALLIYSPGIVSNVNRVCPSIRLKTMRNGIQEYEYMRLLSELDKNADRADKIVNNIINKPFGRNSIGNLDVWSYDAEQWDQNRIKLGELINQTKKQ